MNLRVLFRQIRHGTPGFIILFFRLALWAEMSVAGGVQTVENRGGGGMIWNFGQQICEHESCSKQ